MVRVAVCPTYDFRFESEEYALISRFSRALKPPLKVKVMAGLWTISQTSRQSQTITRMYIRS